AINERSGAMLATLITAHEVTADAVGASLTIPDGASFSDPAFAKKILVAQKGYLQDSGDMIPGAHTPARPVLAVNAEDVAAVHVMLQTHIANWIANGF